MYNIIKKTISLICVLAITLSMVTVAWADSTVANSIVDENFDDWSTIEKGNYIGPFKVHTNLANFEIKEGALKSGATASVASAILLLGDSGHGNPATYIKGKAVMEFKFKQDVVGEAGRMLQITDSSSGNGPKLAITGGNLVTWNAASMKTITAVTAGKWYNVKIIFDAAKATFDLYVDGAQKADDYGFYNESTYNGSICRMIVNVNANCPAVYYDDIKLYEELAGVTVLADENFNSMATGNKVTSISGGSFTSPSSNSNTVAEVATGDNAIKLDSTNASFANLMLEKNGSKNNTVTDNYVVEFKWKKDTVDATTATYATSDEWIYSASGYDTNGNYGQAFRIRLHKNMPLLQYTNASGAAENCWLFGNTSTSVVAGQWYKFKIHVNMADNTYDVYLDDKCVAQTIPFDNKHKGITYNGLMRVFMTESGSKYKGVYWIDDIKIYEDNGLDELLNLNVNIKDSSNLISCKSNFQAKTPGGYVITWTGDKFGIKAVDGKLYAYTDNVGTVTFVPSINYEGRIIAKPFAATVLPIATVLSRINTVLKVDTAAKTVTGTSYGAGDMRYEDEAYFITAVYRGSNLVKFNYVKKSDWTQMQNNYTSTVDISELPAGTYTAKAMILADFASSKPLMKSATTTFEIAQ